jgi:hypothetical protein
LAHYQSLITNAAMPTSLVNSTLVKPPFSDNFTEPIRIEVSPPTGGVLAIARCRMQIRRKNSPSVIYTLDTDEAQLDGITGSVLMIVTNTSEAFLATGAIAYSALSGFPIGTVFMEFDIRAWGDSGEEQYGDVGCFTLRSGC